LAITKRLGESEHVVRQYCVYIAPNEAAVREHAKKGGFPANRISAVRSMIDPATAE
jgi:hypothetical protein